MSPGVYDKYTLANAAAAVSGVPVCCAWTTNIRSVHVDDLGRSLFY